MVCEKGTDVMEHLHLQLIETSTIILTENLVRSTLPWHSIREMRSERSSWTFAIRSPKCQTKSIFGLGYKIMSSSQTAHVLRKTIDCVQISPQALFDPHVDYSLIILRH